MTATRQRFPIAELKAQKDSGEFEGIVSVFNNVDFGDDRIIPGAFADLIAAGQMPPVFWNHAWSLGPIGETIAWEEREKGLWVQGRLFLDTGADLVKRVHASMLAGQTREFSFAYDTAETRRIQEDGRDIREIVRFSKIYELGPVVAGMNPDTELIRVASISDPNVDLEALIAKAVAAELAKAQPPAPTADPGDSPATVDTATLLAKRQED